MSGMRRIGSITAAGLAVAAFAFASAAAAQSTVVPTRKVYWTQPQTEAAVRHNLRIPYCRIFPNDSGCASVPGMKPRQAQCMGVDELGTSFSYSRFTCRIVVTDYYGKPLASGTVAVYPRSATVFAWRLIG